MYPIYYLKLAMNGLTKFVGKKIGAYLSSNTQLQELDICKYISRYIYIYIKYIYSK